MTPHSNLRIRHAFAALAFTVIGGAAVPAHAVPITTAAQTISFCLNCNNTTMVAQNSSTPQTHAHTALNSALTLFDSSLGTLQSVELVWVSGVFGTLTDDPDHGGFDAPSATLKLDASITLGLPGPSSLVAVTESFSETAPFDDNNLTVNVTLNAPLSGNRSITAPADLAKFIGIGTFDTNFKLDVTQVADNATLARGSWGAAPGSTANGGSFSLQYVYEARPTTTNLPEPGTIALAALAGGLGLAARRKYAHRAR